MRLAWRNLRHDRARVAVAIGGILFSVFLMTFEGSLLAGFIAASSRVIDSLDGDLVIAARGVQCIECATPIAGRMADLALGVPGVVAARRVAVGAGVWSKPSGRSQQVVLIGGEPGAGARFPGLAAGGAPQLPDAVVVDQSNAALLEVGTGTDVEINGRHARVAGIASGFGSFLGVPYVFTSHRDAAAYVGNARERTQFVLLTVRGRPLEETRQALAARLPDVDVWTRARFSAESQSYWLLQTGAGGAMLLAAFLGFLVGTVIVSQTTYATTMEHIEEYATLKAIGATRRYVTRLVATQALITCLAGGLLGIALALPAVRGARSAIPWIFSPVWLPPLVLVLTLPMCALASIVSVRKAASIEPAKVFRV
jgi:putative ABC transport system permease protein